MVMEITKNQRIAILVYHEDHPEAHAPEISKATDINYRDVVHTLREYEAKQSRYEVMVTFTSYEEAMGLAEAIKAGGDKVEVADVTPCASLMRHGPGHQSQTYCEQIGPHETHGANIMGMWTEWDNEGEEV